MIKMKDIIDDDNPLLRQKSDEVTLPLSKNDEQLLRDMHTFLVNSQDEELSEKYDLRPAVGIAAIQLGHTKKMCAIRVCDYNDDGEVIHVEEYALVNPVITSYTEKISHLKDGEGCLSVNREVQGIVPRYAKIVVESYDLLQNKEITITARGFMSICMQHEFDHFHGKLFYDHINKENPMAPIQNAIVIE